MILSADNEGLYQNVHLHSITKTRLFKYTENFTIKNENFQIKNSDIFHTSANEAVLTSTHLLCFWAEIRKYIVYPCEPQFYYIKVGYKGVKIIGMFSWCLICAFTVLVCPGGTFSHGAVRSLNGMTENFLLALVVIESWRVWAKCSRPVRIDTCTLVVIPDLDSFTGITHCLVCAYTSTELSLIILKDKN